MVHALGQAQRCLDALENDPGQPVVDDARRPLGHARTSLEYGNLPEILDRLPDQMTMVQLACSAASDAIRSRYFPSGSVTQWTGGVL